MKRLTTILLVALLAPGCQLLGIPERDADSLENMLESPLLVELPPDEPPPELHAAIGPLRIADDAPHDLSFRSTPLRAVLDEIADRAQVTLIVDSAVAGAVDVDFTAISLDDALETLLIQHDLVLLSGPGNVFFVERSNDPTQVTEFIQLVNVRAADVADNLSLLVGEGSRIIADIDRNLICLIGRQSDVAAVRQYLRRVDVLKDQVLLEVHIFEVSYEDGFDFGSIHDITGTANGNAFSVLSNLGLGSAFSATLTGSDGNFQSAIDTISSFVGLELISSPRILAVTNTKAMVDVVQEIPYVETTATTTGTTGGIGSTVQESVEFKEAGIKLEITPSIQEAGFLQIDIMQSIIQEIGRFNEIPVVDRRTLQTQFLVKNRETIVLGGLIQTRHSEERTGIPLLMHIPILGQLFRSDSDVRKKQELLLFVTPRILSPSQAARLAPYYQESYRQMRTGLDSSARPGTGD